MHVPVTTVIHACSRMIRLKPITPLTTVSAITTTSVITLTGVPAGQPSWWNTVGTASVARTTSTVSQPTFTIQEITAGSALPRTPNAARDSTIVGADPRLPAIAMSPQARNDNTIPMIETISACQNEIPNPSTNDPYESPSTETFAANHGQNKSRGVPLRSSSEITLIPFISILIGASLMTRDPLRYLITALLTVVVTRGHSITRVKCCSNHLCGNKSMARSA